MKVNISDWPENSETIEDDRTVEIEFIRADTYALNSTLAHIIHPSLVQYKEDNIGSWCVDQEDLPESLQSEDVWSEEGTNWILDEMIWTFWAVNHYEKDHLDIGWMKEDHPDKIRFNNGLQLFAKYYMNLWW